MTGAGHAPADRRAATAALFVVRVCVLLATVLMFFPALNPAKVSGLINKNLSLFTAGVSYPSVTADAGRALLRGWVSESAFRMLHYASLTAVIGVLACGAGGCMSLGNLKLRRLGCCLCAGGGLLGFCGMLGIYLSYRQMALGENLQKVMPSLPSGLFLFAALCALVLLCSLAAFALSGKPLPGERFSMDTKYRLFLMLLPFLVLAFAFSYLPLYGWRYALYNYKPGGTLSAENYVGFKWFQSLFLTPATRMDMGRVLRNTFVMSGLGILTSWCPMLLAICLAEIRSKRLARAVQTIITIPNFISWVLVYAIALAMFNTDGFVNGFLSILGIQSSENYLMGNTGTWLKMLAWGMWKGVGWSAIVYVAAISGIDPQLYEAATVDGAGRFQQVRYITLPGLMPTYCVLLLLSIASILSNGMDQYFVFENAQNVTHIEVLDLYVYKIGIGNGMIPLSTVVGMMKTIVSLALLFAANKVSRLVRGESIL